MNEQYNYVNTSFGEFLQEYLDDCEISQNGLSLAIGIPVSMINRVIKNKLKLSLEMDLRLAKFFGVSDGFFLGIQEDIDRISKKSDIQKQLDQIIPYAEIIKERGEQHHG